METKLGIERRSLRGQQAEAEASEASQFRLGLHHPFIEIMGISGYERHMRFITALLLLLISAAPVAARPVSFAGGTMPMAEINRTGSVASIDYSPTSHYAVSLRNAYNNEQDSWMQTVGANWLAYRYNGPGSQANIYLRGGAGAITAGDETAAAGFAGITADWESRRYMVAYENEYSVNAHDDVPNMFSQRARLGVAPYTVPYEDWQPWLILQLDHTPQMQEHTSVTPLLRIYRGPILAEGGMSTRGDIFAALTLQF